MRKVVAILALACLLFFMAGYGILYHIRLDEIKTEMKAAISAGDGNNVIRFDFTQKEFSALEWEGRSEFTFKGEMYDVVRKEKVGESIVVWCMDDKSETALVNNYLKFHRPLSEKNTSAALLKFLTLQFQSPALIEVNQSVTLHLFSFPPYVSGLSSAERFILVPPPKCC